MLEELINCKNGQIIRIPAGTFSIRRQLSLEGVRHVIIEGAGMEQTTLSFIDQVEGAEGLLIKNVDSITLRNFALEDTKGDAIKVQNCSNVLFDRISVSWTRGKRSDNGAYGLYPVSCSGVVIDSCKASFAMDAGIYVGQSEDIIVSNNTAFDNVAGIEIENSSHAKVFNNHCYDNTGGMLVFDMPDLPKANGENVHIFNNTIENNNGINFSAPGNVVNMLPPGTGVLVMAHREVTVNNNKVLQHKTMSMGMMSWLFTGNAFSSNEYDPFCSQINLTDNDIQFDSDLVSDTTTQFGQLFAFLFDGKTAGIVVDGIFNPLHIGSDGIPLSDHAICIQGNGTHPVINLHADKGADPMMMKLNMTESSIFDCDK